jgi:hypothetical protein
VLCAEEICGVTSEWQATAAHQQHHHNPLRVYSKSNEEEGEPLGPKPPTIKQQSAGTLQAQQIADTSLTINKMCALQQQVIPPAPHAADANPFISEPLPLHSLFLLLLQCL